MYLQLDKIWGRKPIQTWKSLNELSETKKDYYKTYLLINLVTEFKQVYQASESQYIIIF